MLGQQNCRKLYKTAKNTAFTFATSSSSVLGHQRTPFTAQMVLFGNTMLAPVETKAVVRHLTISDADNIWPWPAPACRICALFHLSKGPSSAKKTCHAQAAQLQENMQHEFSDGPWIESWNMTSRGICHPHSASAHRWQLYDSSSMDVTRKALARDYLIPVPEFDSSAAIHSAN